MVQITNSLYDQFIAEFEARASLGSPVADVLDDLREKAFAEFKQLGFPSTKVEDWKYTNLAPFLKEEFDIDGDSPAGPVESAIAAAKIPSLDCYTIVMVNGSYHAELSDIIPGDGIFILPVAQALGRTAFKNHFGKHIKVEKNHFVALNTALFRHGLYIEVKNKAIIDKPIHIVHVAAPVSDNNLFLQPRHLFVTGAHSELTIAESYVSANGNATVFVNNVSEIAVGENARLQHYYIQTGDVKTRYIHHTEVYQETSSVYNNYKASFPGTSLLRNNLNIVLDGENIESHLYGIYLAGGRQLVDNHTLVDHRKPHCQSNELYKGVMKDEAVGVFNGKIFVRQQAQKTNAFQQNNNLMLSKKAVVDSKPQLEIFADDVKCSHGSTIGQFNDEALFYLKSRGIGTEKAKALLIHAFAFDVTDKIPLPEVQAHINHLIEEGLVSE